MELPREEFQRLLQKFAELKKLARINLDLLFLNIDGKESLEVREELNKVKELVHAVRNGEENDKRTTEAAAALDFDDENSKPSLSDTESLDHYLDTLVQTFKGKEMMDVFQQLLQRAIYRKLVSRCFSLNSLSSESLKKPTPQRSSKRKSRPRKMAAATKSNDKTVSVVKTSVTGDMILMEEEKEGNRDGSIARHVDDDKKKSIKEEVSLNENVTVSAKDYIMDANDDKMKSTIKQEPEVGTMAEGVQVRDEKTDFRHNLMGRERLKKSPKTKELLGLSETSMGCKSVKKSSRSKKELLGVYGTSVDCNRLKKSSKSKLKMSLGVSETSISIKELRKIRTNNILKEFGIPTDIFNSESKDPFVCPICRKLYGGKPSFLAHLRVHKSEKDGTKQTPEPQLCMICGKTMKNIASLKSHLKLHKAKDKGEYLKCHKCGKEFLGEQRLRLHLNKYCHNLRSHLCDLCGKSYKTKQVLELHRRSVHSNSNSKPETCKVCGEGFSNWSNLIRHMRIHRGELPYSCSICGKKFRTSYSRKAHERLHTGNFPYHCSLCDHGFQAPSHLRKHNRLYHPPGETGKLMRKSNRRLYPRGTANSQPSRDNERVKMKCNCDICGKEFSNRSNMTKHKFLHTGTKPHKCPTCGRSFTTYTILKKHMWTHSDVKQFPCDKCDKGFGDKRNLVSHMKKAHPEQPTAISTVSQEIPMPITMVTTTAMVHPDPSLEDAFLPYRPISFQM